MNCPNCNEKVELTAKRYFGSLFGKHICPSCSANFKLKRTKTYFLWIILSIVFIVFSSLFILNSILDKEILNIVFYERGRTCYSQK